MWQDVSTTGGQSGILLTRAPGDGQLECSLQPGPEKGEEGKSGLESSRQKCKALKITKGGE